MSISTKQEIARQVCHSNLCAILHLSVAMFDSRRIRQRQIVEASSTQTMIDIDRSNKGIKLLPFPSHRPAKKRFVLVN